MILKIKGIVNLGDGYRCDMSETCGAVHIGDVDLLEEVMNTNFNNPVTVALADERFEGDLGTCYGWGYSEWTPMDYDQLFVGKHDIIKVLYDYEGQEVTLWIADEPVNTLEDEYEG